jgi:hypothetical protein
LSYMQRHRREKAGITPSLFCYLAKILPESGPWN